jgi:hypothetical protein
VCKAKKRKRQEDNEKSHLTKKPKLKQQKPKKKQQPNDVPAIPSNNNNNNIINNVDASKFIGVDLGRKSLFAAASQTKQWSWSNKTWQFESGSTKAKRKLQHWKAKEGIDLIEQNMPSHCTTDRELLLDWFNYTVRHLDTLCEFYHQTKCR